MFASLDHSYPRHLGPNPTDNLPQNITGGPCYLAHSTSDYRCDCSIQQERSEGILLEAFLHPILYKYHCSTKLYQKKHEFVAISIVMSVQHE